MDTYKSSNRLTFEQVRSIINELMSARRNYHGDITIKNVGGGTAALVEVKQKIRLPEDVVRQSA